VPDFPLDFLAGLFILDVKILPHFTPRNYADHNYAANADGHSRLLREPVRARALGHATSLGQKILQRYSFHRFDLLLAHLRRDFRRHSHKLAGL